MIKVIIKEETENSYALMSEFLNRLAEHGEKAELHFTDEERKPLAALYYTVGAILGLLLGFGFAQIV